MLKGMANKVLGAVWNGKTETTTLLVGAEPQRKLGDVAVWDLADIPRGVPRQPAYATIDRAANARTLYTSFDVYHYQEPPAHRELYAVVRWADLRPIRPVPRGRDTMTPRQWGTNRDEYGVCGVCRADDSMHCDSVAHDQHKERLRIPVLINAQPVLFADNIAVWRSEDIPRGIPRYFSRATVEAALEVARSYGAPAAVTSSAEFSAVRWCDLQPAAPASDQPRPSLAGALAAAYGATPCTSVTLSDGKTYRLSDGKTFTLPDGRTAQIEDWIDDKPHSTVPYKPAGAPAAAGPPMSAFFGEDIDRSKVTAKQRESWAQALRERQRAARECERNRVLVDREFEDWE
jgi:hypothetical protein